MGGNSSADWLETTPIAHRGLHSNGLPENSLGAFIAAAKAGYAIELDVHCSADGKLIVMHDDQTGRVTGKDYLIRDTSSEVLTKLQLEGTQYRVPLLEEALEAVEKKVPVLIEVKTGTSASRIGPILTGVIRDAEMPLAVESFDPRIIGWFKSKQPGIPRGQLCGSFKGEDIPALQKVLLRTMFLNSLTRPNFISYDINSVSDVFLRIWRRILDVPLILWTVRNQQQLDIARSHHANFIFEGIRPQGA